ncbi:MAG: hypothetical protein H0W72_15930 [Planctomycetes bacterium]|nr:hypothetical protein [Planctomycetota bacterium]
MSPTGIAQFLVLSLSILLFGGCISHVARIDSPSTPPVQGVIGVSYLAPVPDVTQRAGPLPQDVPVSAWLIEDDGLSRFEGRCRTPLPWWQRFPADLVSDLLPGTYVSMATLTIAPTAVAPADPQALAAAAHAAGYAAPDAP